MLQIQVFGDQQSLLTQLEALFPDLALEKREQGIDYYRAELAEGTQATRQVAFLRKHDFLYVDQEQQRIELIKAFFEEAEVEGKPIDCLKMRRVCDRSNYHSATLISEDGAVCLRFPPEWDPLSSSQGSPYTGWLYVHQQNDLVQEGQEGQAGNRGVCASTLGSHGHIMGIIHMTLTPHEMMIWLRQQRYSQMLCFTYVSSVYGLYQPIHVPRHS